MAAAFSSRPRDSTLSKSPIRASLVASLVFAFSTSNRAVTPMEVFRSLPICCPNFSR